MTDLKKYQISAAHEKGVRESGFDARDPDKRHPVQNHVAGRIITERSNQKQMKRDSRIAQLFKAKDRGKDHARDRALALAILIPCLGGILNAPAHAGAHIDIAPAIAPQSWLGALIERAVELASSCPSLIIFTAALFALSLNSILQKGPMMHMPLRRSKHTHSETVAPIRDQAPEKQIEAPVAPTEPKRPEWIMNASSRMGKVRTENQDAFKTLSLPQARSAMIICDGAGGVAGGKLAAKIATKALATELQAAFSEPNVMSWTKIVERAFASARHAVEANQEAGITTAIIAVMSGTKIHYATLGDGALSLIWPDGMIQHLLAAHHHRDMPSNVITGYIGHGCTVPPRLGDIRVETGAVLLAMSDGVSDLLPFDDIAASLEQISEAHLKPGAELADALLAQIEAARDPDTGAYLHHDNMTLAISVLSERSNG